MPQATEHLEYDMSTDRNRRPAGSPASTGGQYAPTTSPGQAGTIDTGSSIETHLARLGDAQRAERAAAVAVRQAAAAAMAHAARAAGATAVNPSRAYRLDERIPHAAAITVSEYPVTLDELDLAAHDPRHSYHRSTATSHAALIEFAQLLRGTDTDPALRHRGELIEQCLGNSCGGINHDATVTRAEDRGGYELLVAVGADDFGTVTPEAVTLTGAQRTHLARLGRDARDRTSDAAVAFDLSDQ